MKMFIFRQIIIKSILLVVLLFSPVYVQSQETVLLTKEIKTSFSDYKGAIEVQLQEYDEMKFKHVYLEHRKERKKYNEVDFLYVKGAIKNLMNRHLSGATVTAKFMNDEGQEVEIKAGSVIPRIIRLNGEKKGYFTVKVPFDHRIKTCRLDINWTGKEEWYQ